MPPWLALCHHLTSKQQLKGPAYCTSKKSELPPGTSTEQISLIKRWRDESGRAKPLPTSVSLLSPLKLQSRTRETNTIKALFLCVSCLEIGRRHYLKLARHARNGTRSKSYKGKLSPACNTCLRLVCSTMFPSLWATLFGFKVLFLNTITKDVNITVIIPKWIKDLARRERVST